MHSGEVFIGFPSPPPTLLLEIMATKYITTYPTHEDWLACNYCQEYGTDGCEYCCRTIPVKEEKL